MSAGFDVAKGSIVKLVGPQGEYTRVCPKNTTEATKTLEAASWRALEVSHISELERNETITEVHRSEAGERKVHPVKLDYKIKIQPDSGEWDKDKVRGCVDTSRSWDSNEYVFADTLSHSEMCVVVASAAKYGHRLLKIDIKDAHPNTDLPFAHFAQMFKHHARYQADGTQSIYRVDKGLPGLPPAARAFNRKLRDAYEKIGFTKLPSLRAMIRLAGTSPTEGERIIGGTIVDDILLAGPDELLEYALKEIGAAFGGAITHEYDPRGFGGHQIRRSYVSSAITVAVPEKIYSLAALLGVSYDPAENKKQFGPPAITKEDLEDIEFDYSNAKLDAEQKLCQRATGLLTWITGIRLDVIYFGRKCARVMSAPKAVAVLKVLRAIAQALVENPYMGKTFAKAPGVTSELEIVRGKDKELTPIRIFDEDKPAPESFELVHDATFATMANTSVGTGAYMFMGA